MKPVILAILTGAVLPVSYFLGGFPLERNPFLAMTFAFSMWLSALGYFIGYIWVKSTSDNNG